MSEEHIEADPAGKTRLTGEDLLPFLQERKELNDKLLVHYLRERRRTRMPREDAELYAAGLLHARLGDDLLLVSVRQQASTGCGTVNLTIQIGPEDVNAATQRALELVAEVYGS